jgi:cytochrome oxidase Cu insertion factor (SCO1/SenC/PrrC family)
LSLAFSLGFLAAWAAAPEHPRQGKPVGAAIRRVQVGQEAPDFTLRSPDGSSRTLSELRGQKNLVLIFFRGTW